MYASYMLILHNRYDYNIKTLWINYKSVYKLTIRIMQNLIYDFLAILLSVTYTPSYND